MLSEALRLIHREDGPIDTDFSVTMCPHLLDPDLLVRPPGAPLPAPLRDHGGPLASVFAAWLRQRDDAHHAPQKAALSRALQALSDDDIQTHALRQSHLALQGGWSHWSWAVPASTVGSLLGLAMATVDDQRRLHQQLRAMAVGLSADADAASVTAAGEAVSTLLAALDEAERQRPDAPLQWTLIHHAPPARWSSRDGFAANRLALIWQSHEAGAALLGQGLIEMTRLDRAPSREDLLRIADEGGAVRNTRRFARHRMTVDGEALEAGASVVVALAGTGHPFGDGPHRCPGQALSLTVIHTALRWLRDQPGLAKPAAAAPLTLANMVIPQFIDGPIPAPSQESSP